MKLVPGLTTEALGPMVTGGVVDTMMIDSGGEDSEDTRNKLRHLP